MLIPTGFWSYATSEDTSSRGRLSQLRARLADELQQQLGRARRVNIFQDVAAIPPGAEWKQQITAAVDASFFLIPIVTPAFLESKWCCQEVNLFRARQKEFGGASLIFPIHYIDVDHFEEVQDEYADLETLKFLRTIQWIDFRHLRLKSPDGEGVAEFLERLAKGVASALRKATPLDTPASKPSAAQLQNEQAVLGGRGANVAHRPPDQSAAIQEIERTLGLSSEFAQLEARAQAGDARAQVELGYSLATGEGVAIDDRAAVGWFRKAAEQGYADAQFLLGVFLHCGKGTPKDEAAAVLWYRKAAEQGYADAQFNLGVSLEYGEGAPKDEAAAVGWYQKAAEQGQERAKSRLEALRK